MRLTIRPKRILNISNSYELLRSLDYTEETLQNRITFKRIILDLSSRMAYNTTLEQVFLMNNIYIPNNHIYVLVKIAL